jgi:tetratricopeptide (TPR) repeat protein
MDDVSAAQAIEETGERLTRTRILEAAAALAKEHREHAALELLLAKRDEFTRVPPGYDVAIGRLYADIGNHAAALEYFESAQIAFGEDPPAGFRAVLAKSLLAVRRVEQAGQILDELATARRGEGRPVKLSMTEQAAIAAYENMHGKRPDQGRPTVYRILAEAEVLAEQKDNDAALALLRAHRDEWDDKPPRYAFLLKSLGRNTEEVNARIDRKKAKRLGGAKEPTAEDHRRIGTKLFDAGRFEEAAPEIAAAIRLGAEIHRRDIGMLGDLYLRKQGDPNGYDTSFGRNYTLVNHEKRLVFVPINKNASTFLKANFILNSPHREDYLNSAKFIHQFCDGLPKAASRSELLRPDYSRFTILREPAKRLVSAYLNKLVQGRGSDRSFGRLMLQEHAIRKAQEMAGVTFDAERSLTFEEFVHFIVSVEDYELNRHWLPQYRFVGTDLSRYDFVGTMENLQETLDYLTEKFGFKIETEHESRSAPIGGASYRRTYTESAVLEEPHKALPSVLDRYEANMPAASLFYTPELRRLVEQRFAPDFEIYAAVSGGARVR